MKKFTIILILIFAFLLICSCSDKSLSAYEIYCEANPSYTGTEDEWLESLKGSNGKSAYEIYCEANPDYTGTEDEWLESLKGSNGKSAYEIYCEANPDYTGTEDEWLIALSKGELECVNHTVTFDLGYGGTTFEQVVRHGEKIIRPDTPKRLGYKFVSWVYSDGINTETWSFPGYVVTENIKLTATWDFATKELPIVNINTNGDAINSKEDYTDMLFSIENCEDELIGISGGIRLRGNSTMGYDKKPYRIKFDKKQSLFGLDKAKSWVLLADYLDPSALHNYTAFTLGASMESLGFTPTPNKVNVYLNNEFVGLYTLCEQVQENKGRMDIELDEITESMVNIKDYNFFISMDESCIYDAGATLDETYFYIEDYDKYFEIKYPEKDAFSSDEQFSSFVSQLKTYVKNIMDAFYTKDLATLQSEVNLNSLADYLIIDQIMGEHDHEKKSFNMFFTNTSDDSNENGKLSFGPIWDYDLSLHAPWTGAPNEYYEISDEIFYSNLFFQSMASIPELYQLVKERYNNYAKPALEDYLEEFDTTVESMTISLQLNHLRWYNALDDKLTDKNIEFLKEFLTARKAQLDILWSLN